MTSISLRVNDDFDVLHEKIDETENLPEMDQIGPQRVLTHNRKLDKALQLKIIFWINLQLSISLRVNDDFDVFIDKTENLQEMDQHGPKGVLSHNRKLEKAFQLKMLFLKNLQLSISLCVIDDFDVLQDKIDKAENLQEMDENGPKSVLSHNRKLEKALQLKMLFSKNLKLAPFWSRIILQSLNNILY